MILWSHLTESTHAISEIWKHVKFLGILRSAYNYIPFKEYLSCFNVQGTWLHG